jgi:lysophospholipase L1-like esterase
MSPPCRTSKRTAEALAGAIASLLAVMGCSPRERVTFVGDSITAEGSWKEAFPHLQVSNQGVPGDRAIDVLARLQEVGATEARLYLLMVGINDLRRGIPPEEVAGHIGEIRQRLLESASPPPRVVVLSTLQCRPLPANRTGNGCSEAVRAKVELLNRDLRRQTPQDDFLDLNAQMSPGGLLDRAYTGDGIHLTAAGYRRWRTLLAPLLSRP